MAAEQIGKDSSPAFGAEPDRSLWGWVVFSGVVHVVAVGVMLFALAVPVRRTINYPVYSVELVGGEKLGGRTVGTEIAPAPQPKETKKAEPEPVQTARIEKEKKIVEKEKKIVEKEKKVKELEKPQKLEKAPPPAPSKDLPDDVREKLIQAALERVKQRASEVTEKKSATETREKTKAESSAKKGEALSSGPGEGVGAAAPGEGGRGGGTVKGMEFLIYRNRMLQLIKDRWTWVGSKSDLAVTVRFGIKENGEIYGLKVVQASGDASFDNSVIRAVRGVNPLPPPPEAYRVDFTDVELIFRPADLRG